MTIYLINRADDIGSSVIANEAVIDACTDGLATNTSLMVPPPSFVDAVERLRAHPEIEVGLHATITDEWDTPRWGPVLGAQAVPSLVYDDGTFFKNCTELWERYGDETQRPSNDEILAEVSAQLKLARAAGLSIAYMDTHMGFDWFHGLQERLADFCEQEGLIFANTLGLQHLPKVDGDYDDPIERLVAQLRACEDGKTYLQVAHPAYPRGDMMDMSIRGSAPGEIAIDRDRQRRQFMDPRVTAACAELGIECIRYSDFAAATA